MKIKDKQGTAAFNERISKHRAIAKEPGRIPNKKQKRSKHR
jgi:hypothetical protein